MPGKSILFLFKSIKNAKIAFILPVFFHYITKLSSLLTEMPFTKRFFSTILWIFNVYLLY